MAGRQWLCGSAHSIPEAVHVTMMQSSTPAPNFTFLLCRDSFFSCTRGKTGYRQESIRLVPEVSRIIMHTWRSVVHLLQRSCNILQNICDHACIC